MAVSSNGPIAIRPPGELKAERAAPRRMASRRMASRRRRRGRHRRCSDGNGVPTIDQYRWAGNCYLLPPLSYLLRWRRSKDRTWNLEVTTRFRSQVQISFRRQTPKGEHHPLPPHPTPFQVPSLPCFPSPTPHAACCSSLTPLDPPSSLPVASKQR